MRGTCTANKRRGWRAVTFLLLPIALAFGCEIAIDSADCQEGGVNVLPSAETVSELTGESGATLLAAAGTTVTDSAAYASSEEVLTQTPLGGTSTLTITTGYNDGEIREIKMVGISGKSENDLHCRPRLEMDVTVNVETADGAFMESWPAVLSREKGGAPILKADFDPDAQFNGTFRIVSYNNPSSPDQKTGTFTNYFRANGDRNGNLQFGLTHRSGDSPVGHVTHDALTW